MEEEWMYLLLLLLPVAALSGWWAARRGSPKGAAKSGGNISPEYFKGLNYVLNEQPDKAIEVFIRMAEVDSGTVETHLALGNLFRRRGEVDRAIRIHQNLIARPTLSYDERALALLELGIDYMRSGLLDRAEGLFKELVDSGVYTVQAFRELLDIYQQEKDWDNAITMARRLETVSGERMNPVIAQFYCELACESFSLGNDREVKGFIKRALNIDPKCVRASLMEAEMAQTAGQPKAALGAYRRIERQDPDYLPEAIKPMIGCYRDIGRLDEAMKYLEDILHKYGGITPLLYLTGLIEEVNGKEAAIGFLSSQLKRRPTVRGVDRLIEYTLSKAEGEIHDNLKTIKEMTNRLLENRSIYRCENCGFDGKSLHWQCPGCKRWNTIKPVHGVEGE